MKPPELSATNTATQGVDVEFDWKGDVVRQKKGGGFVYFIEGGGFVKIGVSAKPQRRVDAMRTGSPVSLSLLGYYPGGFALEGELHSRFQNDRSHGEWFRPSYALDVEIHKAHEYMEEHRAETQQAHWDSIVEQVTTEVRNSQ